MKNTLMLAGYWGNALIYGLTYICDLRSDKPPTFTMYYTEMFSSLVKQSLFTRPYIAQVE